MASIAILGGTGRQGRGLAQRFARAGERVIVGSRDPVRARETIANWAVDRGAIDAADYGDAVSSSEIVVLAVPFDAVDTLLADVAPRFHARSIVVDVTVPVAFAGGRMSMIDVAEGSASEHVRARIPAEVAIAAAFKTLPAHLLGAVDKSLDCDEFVCGDSPDAKTAAAELVKRLPGVRPIDIGPLSRARFIEHATALAIAVNRAHKIHDARFRVVGLP
jgi:8-hydroxy-5-deazaflavin:NADPH oxidoreductase